MSHSNIYYAVYDVAEDGTRDAVIHALKNSGLVRVQKSVFCGNLQPQLRKDLLENIKSTIDPETDSFFLIMNCNDCFGKIMMLGNDFDQSFVDGSKSGMVL